MHKGHYGEYSGNAKHSKVTISNYKATKKDDEAHMTYLKEDIDYDNKHGHSDSSMTADEKHISRLAGDLKYDEKKHGSPAKMMDDAAVKAPTNNLDKAKMAQAMAKGANEAVAENLAKKKKK